MDKKEIEAALDKIDILTTAWMPAPDTHNMILHAHADVYFLSKGGGEYLEHCFSRVALSEMEIRDTYNPKDLMEFKRKEITGYLRGMLKEKLSSRCGLPNHRGYFNFIGIRNWREGDGAVAAYPPPNGRKKYPFDKGGGKYAR